MGVCQVLLKSLLVLFGLAGNDNEPPPPPMSTELAALSDLELEIPLEFGGKESVATAVDTPSSRLLSSTRVIS